MTRLTLAVLGQPHITRDETAVSLPTRKTIALLTYLAVTREAQSRESLTALLWPHANTKSAKASLRNAISLLKRNLGNVIDADRQFVTLNWQMDIVVDVHEFAQKATDVDTLAQAVQLYRDDFLAGFTLPDSSAFDEWQFFETERHRQTLAHILDTLIQYHEQNGEVEQAIPYARRWVQLDPLHEPAHASLIGLYALAGQRAAALRQFEICQTTLDEEFGIAPSPETEARIQPKTSPVPPESQQVADETTAVHHLPTYATSFVGRRDELKNIMAQLVQDGVINGRLVTLTGMGGVGKTRLAIQLVKELTDFIGNIYYIDLVPLRSTHQILPTIFSALAVPLKGADSPQEQLSTFLQNKRCLLILDNFEHLIEGAETIGQLVEASSTTQLIITSRETLNLHQEWVYPLRGLPVPTAQSEQPISSYGSVQLFVQRARQFQPDFKLAQEKAAVVRICQLVEGVPLGIELAAAWIRLLPCAQIAQEIANNVDFLTSTRRDMPDRHRSLRAVFEHSWQLLLSTEQTTLTQLAIFRGGATWEAIQAIIQTSLFILHSLVNKSLLRLEENGRYTLHELLRQFALEKQDPHMAYEVWQRYCAYYTQLIQKQENSLGNTEQQASTVSIIQQELENIRQAWHWAVDHQQVDFIEKSLHGLYLYYTTKSQYQEITKLIQYALDQFAPHQHQTRYHPILMRLNTRQGELFQNTGQLEKTKKMLYETLRYAEPLKATNEMAIAYRIIGLTAYRQGAYTEAQIQLTKAIELTDSQAKPLYHNLLLLSLGAVEVALGHYDQAKTYLQDCLHSYQAHQYQWGIAHALRHLGKTAMLQQDTIQARLNYEQSLAHCQQMNHEAGEALVLNELGVWYVAKGHYDKAHQLLQTALTRSLTSQTEAIRAESLKNLGYLMTVWQEPEKAMGYLQEGLQTAVTTQSTPLILDILLTMAPHLPLAKQNMVYNLVRQHPATSYHTRQKVTQTSLPINPTKQAEQLQTVIQFCVTFHYLGEHPHDRV